jgi:hypothetical protein
MKEKSKKVLEIQKSLNTIIGVETILKKKKRSPTNKDLEDFIKTISILESLYIRSSVFLSETDISLSDYDAKFYKLIDLLIESKYGDKAAKLILFYVYDRIDESGDLVPLKDVDGKEFYLETPFQLFELINNINGEK